MKSTHNAASRLFGSLVLLLLIAQANAATISFSTDPFAGSTALTTPGRQVVGGEIPISFNPATDVFAFDPAFFDLTSIAFANSTINNLPTTGVNVVVLETFDNDGNPATPFGAGSAATLIADQITSPGAGLFVYFNSGLDLARLVYSTDLSDGTADLKILARLTNLSGAAGKDALADFTSANFTLTAAHVPDTSSSVGLLLPVLAALGCLRRRACRVQR